MSWFNTRPRGYKHVSGADAPDTVAVAEAFKDAAQGAVAPTAPSRRHGAQEATFPVNAPANEEAVLVRAVR